jgi:hypothetical protein
VTGTFTGIDSNSDGIIQAASSSVTDTGSGINEFSILNVTLTDTADTTISYNIDQLIGFSNLNFNFETISGTILQSLDSSDPLQGTPGNYTAGLSIGDSTDGFALQSSSSAPLRQFSDFTGFDNNDSGANALDATPVPFEFEGSAGMLVVGGIFGLRHWYKKRKLSNK